MCDPNQNQKNPQQEGDPGCNLRGEKKKGKKTKVVY